MAAAMWAKPHLLALDEPTNYLDREALAGLSDAIKNFKGGVFMVSHNDSFVTSLSTETWTVADGHVRQEKKAYAWEKDDEDGDEDGDTVSEEAKEARKEALARKQARDRKKAEKLSGAGGAGGGVGKGAARSEALEAAAAEARVCTGNLVSQPNARDVCPPLSCPFSPAVRAGAFPSLSGVKDGPVGHPQSLGPGHSPAENK